MEQKSTITKFNVGDIVTIAKDYKDSANLDFAQPQIHVYSVRTVNADGTITLAGVLNDIPAKYIEGVPIESELARQIYYDTNHARPYEPGKVYQHEDVCSRPPFIITMAERLGNTPLWEKMQAEEFHYVHELQHWLIEHMGASRICVNQFFGKRKTFKV
ncbi:MAG: hypothetical protein IKW98_06070 [Prevotella sp.]|nr:hypothetical protein [Prevotella sp.]